jgi:N-acetylglucosaminyl-diphospho-decaprenol L-rhamnosyltransferase
LSNTSNKITVSIVSHDQRLLIENLLKDLVTFEEINKLIITVNIPENKYNIPSLLNEKIQFIYNDFKKGFGGNHNYAFKHCQTELFCVLNPDLRFEQNPFPKMINALEINNLNLVAPIVHNTKQEIEDSFREYLTPARLFARYLKIGKYNPKAINGVIYPDWIAGMIMLFQSNMFRELGGFDERYFMYCEDMDICKRANKASYKTGVLESCRVIHDARRTSRKKIKYLFWHISSLTKFWKKSLFL